MFTQFFGQCPLLEASFNDPNGITFDEYTQTLFISEFDSPNIRKIRLY